MGKTNVVFLVTDAIAYWCSLIGNVLGSIMVAGMTALITVDVLSRFVFGIPTYIATEVSGYLMAGMVYLGLAWTSRMGQQIEVTIAIDPLSKKKKGWIKFATLTVSVAFVVWLCILTTQPVIQNIQFHTTSITQLKMPIWIPTICVPIGLGMLAIQLFSQWLKQTANIITLGDPSAGPTEDLNPIRGGR